jgi:putative phosphoribosyl transferase
MKAHWVACLNLHGVKKMNTDLRFPRFDSRVVAGAVLAKLVSQQNFKAEVVVIGLTRGGMPVAEQVARQLDLPVHPLVVRKIGAPNNPELACGAVASGGVVVWIESVCANIGLSSKEREDLRKQALDDVEERAREIGATLTSIEQFRGKSIILVDDGIATGASIRVAVKALLTCNPREVCIAVPIAPRGVVQDLSSIPKCSVLCVHQVDDLEFGSVGQWYKDFTQVENETCREIARSHPQAPESYVSEAL